MTLNELATEASKPPSKAQREALERLCGHKAIVSLRHWHAKKIVRERRHVDPVDAFGQTAFGILNAVATWSRANPGASFQSWCSTAIRFEMTRWARDTSAVYNVHTLKDGHYQRTGDRVFLTNVGDPPAFQLTDSESPETVTQVQPSDDPSPEETFSNRERLEAVEIALDTAFRAHGAREWTTARALTRRVMGGESAAAIARDFDRSREWGRSTINKGLAKAVALLRDQGFEPVLSPPTHVDVTGYAYDDSSLA